MCQDRTSDLVASVYSITSSARSKIEVGTRPHAILPAARQCE